MPDILRTQEESAAKPPLTPGGAFRQLKENLRSQPWIECDLINVDTTGSTMIISGCVYSTAERQQVEMAAGKIPGVTAVDNRITLIKEQLNTNV